MPRSAAVFHGPRIRLNCSVHGPDLHLQSHIRTGRLPSSAEIASPIEFGSPRWFMAPAQCNGTPLLIMRWQHKFKLASFVIQLAVHIRAHQSLINAGVVALIFTTDCTRMPAIIGFIRSDAGVEYAITLPYS